MEVLVQVPAGGALVGLLSVSDGGAEESVGPLLGQCPGPGEDDRHGEVPDMAFGKHVSHHLQSVSQAREETIQHLVAHLDPARQELADVWLSHPTDSR